MKKLLFIPAMLAMVTVACNNGNSGSGKLTKWSDEVKEEMEYYLGEVLPFVALNKSGFFHEYDELEGYYYIGDDNKTDLMTEEGGYRDLLLSLDFKQAYDDDQNVYFSKGNLVVYADYYEAGVNPDGQAYNAGNQIAATNLGGGGGGGDIEGADILDYTCFGASSTAYVDGTYSSSSGATYKANCAAGNSGDVIQIRSKNNSGIICTVSAGTVSQIAIEFDEETTPLDKTVNIYGSNSAFTATSELYGSLSPVGTIVFDGSSQDGIYYYTFTTTYSYFGLRSSSGAIYMYQVGIFWE